MKKIFFSTIALMLLMTTVSFAGDAKVSGSDIADDSLAKVKVISTISTPAPGSKESIVVIQVDDQKNGVVCYGLTSASTMGRGDDAGYPKTSMSCVQSKRGWR